jgi:gluconokinase
MAGASDVALKYGAAVGRGTRAVRPRTSSRARIVVVAGVAGSGKSTVGRALARALGWRFLEGDAFHPPANVAKMRRGIGLTDRDRAPWLAAVRRAMIAALASAPGVVVACSALRARYRRALARGRRDVLFVWLDLTPAEARVRLAHRRGHFAGPALVHSQFATAERPRAALVLDATRPVRALVAEAVERISSGRAPWGARAPDRATPGRTPRPGGRGAARRRDAPSARGRRGRSGTTPR